VVTALDRVAAHEQAPSTQSRDFTGCIKALLQMEATPAAKAKRYNRAITPLSLSAAAGCESCVETLLEHHLQHDNKLSFTQWHDAVLRAVGCVQLGVVQKLFTAISDEALKRRVRCAALEFALNHHQRHFIAGGSERLHSSCAGMMQIFSWLRDEVPDCQCWGNEQAALSSFINYNCVEGVRRLAETLECDVDLDSLLHEACAQPYDSDMVMELVRLGADIYSEVSGASDKSSNNEVAAVNKPRNVLQIAVLSGSAEIVRALQKLERERLDEGYLPLIMQPCAGGSSVLHAAVADSSSACDSFLEALLHYKDDNLAAALQMVDSRGKTAVHCAVEQHKYELAERLLQACDALGVESDVLAVKDEADVNVLHVARRIATKPLGELLTPYIEQVSVQHAYLTQHQSALL
jgi:ankyrin repeat protein